MDNTCEDFEALGLDEGQLKALADSGFQDIIGQLLAQTGDLGRGVRGVLTPATGGAAAYQWKNTTGRAVVVDKVVVRVNTASGALGALAVGSVAADNNPTTTTSSNNLIDAGALTAAGTLDNITAAGTAGKSAQVVAANGYITATVTGTVGALAGRIWFHYLMLD